MIRLDSATSTLLLLERPIGMPEIVHWGARLPDRLTVAQAGLLRARARRPNALDDDIPAATIWPTVGVGLFQEPALVAHREGRDWTAEFAVRDVTGDAARVEIIAEDAIAALHLTLHLALDRDVLSMSAVLRNEGESLIVDRLAAGVFVLPTHVGELLVQGGRWGDEFIETRMTLPSGAYVIENRRGRTSHDRHPLLLAGTAGFGETQGTLWSVHLGWSGNHRLSAERLPDGSLGIVTGELFEPGEVILATGETLMSPVAYSARSEHGLTGLTRAHHTRVRSLLRWPEGAMSPRPVTMNTWEGNYFDHNEARMFRQAEVAAALGIERFVLDDGWMRGRRSDERGLGDWVADPDIYPRGLAPLVRHVTDLGMQFGLWVEPEMVNADSDLVRDNPEWVLRVAGRPLRTARHQVVLDLTRAAVMVRVHAALEALLSNLAISYLKWDMNRDLVAAADVTGRAATRRQVLAVYDLIDRLREAHPGLEIESCASGGGRADLGVLARTHRVWASDGTDPLDRLSIQRGIGRLLPPETVGAHISSAPNHVTGRRHSLAFRAAVALFGHLGVELDPTRLEDPEREELRAWIALHKRLRPTLHGGDAVRLDPVDGRSLSGVVAPDRGAGVWLAAQEISRHRSDPAPLRLPGLAADRLYRVVAPAPQALPARHSEAHAALFGPGWLLPGGVLAEVGFVPPPLDAEQALVIEATVEA